LAVRSAPLKGLKAARRLFNSGKYKEVIRQLEPVIFQYRESFAFFYLLGISCLHNGELGGALSYLQRARQLKEHNINTSLALAVVYLKKSDKENALRTWLTVLEIDPKNKIARRGLDLIRKYSEPEDIVELINSPKINRLIPAKKKNLPGKVLFFILFFICIGIGAGGFFYYKPTFPDKPIRPGMETYDLSQKQGLIDYSRTYTYTFSENEILDVFEKIRSLFQNYRDNRAIVEINRLLHSNARMDIKSMLFALKDHMITPDFSTFKKSDNFTYTEVIKEPFLYADTFVIWEGRVGGLEITPEQISFDFWVGTIKEFFGVVPVILKFGENLSNGDTVRVLGKVVLDQADGVTLEGVGVQRVVQD
jgi:tetratricopeptide (TPR) repeat protein